MKRQIKFRVYDDRLKKFNYFDLTNATGNLPSDCLNNVQQFSGLFDKNGVEIYEGDILTCCNNKNYVVSFELGCFTISDCLLLRNENDLFEVIGNTFQTPKLLK